MRSHLTEAGFDGSRLIVQSNGESFDVRDACIRVLTSGPAAGVVDGRSPNLLYGGLAIAGASMSEFFPNHAGQPCEYRLVYRRAPALVIPTCRAEACGW